MNFIEIQSTIHKLKEFDFKPLNRKNIKHAKEYLDLCINSLKKERDRIHSLEIKEQENERA